jgi:Ser/Thr protein kinase RdoA (MazF antagonist)
MAGLADQVAWGDVAPPHMPEQIAGAVRALILLCAPVTGLQNQVIHGDLKHHNILIAPGEAPAFIDFSPYWRPPEFAAAIAAYWLGPYHGWRALTVAARVSMP